MTRNRRSPILDAVHETAVDLHEAGAIDQVAMHEFDRLCQKAAPAEPSPIPPTQVLPSAFAQANAAGRRQLARGQLATAASYKAGRVHVELNNGCAFAFPVAQVEDLAGASTKDLRHIEIAAGGLGLYFPRLDADLYVPNLVKGVLGTKRWMSQIGALGGHITSTAKATAARNNGKLGGRPKKTASPTT